MLSTTAFFKGNNGHIWKFFRAGGFDQVRLESGADLMALDQLDPKLWVALSCPAKGLEFDTRTLELIDTDKDGRIRVPEIIAAVKWAGSMVKNPDDFTKSPATLPLAAINDQTPDGKQLLASAKQILATLGKAAATEISVDDAADTVKIFSQTKLNGDGIVPAETATDEATALLITDIITCLGGEKDRSGLMGVSQAKVDQFFTEAQSYADWCAKSEADAANVLPLGEATHGAFAALKNVRAKVDDYFTRTRLAAFDARALGALNRVETEYVALTARDLSSTGQELVGFPLSKIEAGRPLPLGAGLNPAWAGAMSGLVASVVTPVLGARTELTPEDWAAINAKFAAYETWFAGKAGASVEKLGVARVRSILSTDARVKLSALIEQDKGLEAEFNAISSVERLVRYYRDLFTLLNNFVSFRDFYTRKANAVFQVGTLYLDQRSCELCVRVDDGGKHGVLAGFSKSYLAYCDCVRTATAEKMTIAAAFTDGDSDNLMVGRNGVFYDRKGRDWEATIVKIVENPISIRQAFWSPYKRFIRMVEDQVAKRAAAADAAVDSQMATAATATVNVDKSKKPEPKKIDVGTVAAIGVAVGGITAALGGLLQAFFGLGIWMPLGVLALVMCISGPSMLIAWLKLRQRNLGPILDANGWAVNARAKINIPFGASLTGVATLPPGAQRDLIDPFADKRSPWRTWLILALLVVFGAYWYVGKLDDYVPGAAKSVSVLGTNAPAYKAPVAPVPVAPAVTSTNVVK